jgi:hypothetical protein
MLCFVNSINLIADGSRHFTPPNSSDFKYIKIILKATEPKVADRVAILAMANRLARTYDFRH